MPSFLPIPPRLEAVIDEPSLAEFAPDKFLAVGSEGFTSTVQKWKLEVGENGAQILDVTLSGRLARELVNAPVTFWVYVDRYPVRLFDGVAKRPVLKRASTQLVAETPLAQLDRVPLGAPLAAKLSATQLVRAAIGRTGMYSPAQIRVEDLGSTMNKGSTDGYEASEDVRSVLSDVSDETRAIFRDVALGGFEGFLPQVALGRPSWAYEADAAIGEDGWTVEEDAEEMFAAVVVERPSTSQPGTSEVQSGSVNTPGFVVKVPVPYQGLQYKPHPSLIDWITVSEDTGTTGKAQAKRLALREARWHAAQRFGFELKVPFNPYLLFGDAVRVGENEVDHKKRRWRNEYLCVMDGGVTHEDLKLTTVSGKASSPARYRVHEPPVRIFSEPSDSVVATPEPAVGFDDLGLFVEPARTLNSAGVFWAGIDEGGLWIDPALSEGVAGIDDGGLWIDVASLSGIGEDAGGLWIDPVMASGWAGIDEGGLWVDPSLSGGLAGIDENGLYLEL